MRRFLWHARLCRLMSWLEARGSVAAIPRGGDGARYLDRAYLFHTPRVSVFLHRLWADDEDGVHCHPWDNLSIVLGGGYWEDHHDGTTRWRGPGAVVFRQAEVLHRLRLGNGTDSRVRFLRRVGDTVLDYPSSKPGSCWSLFIKFKRRRQWGFFERQAEASWAPKAKRTTDLAKLEGRVWFPRFL